MSETRDEGGDPACWLSQVCPECGAFVEDDVPHECRGEPRPEA